MYKIQIADEASFTMHVYFYDMPHSIENKDAVIAKHPTFWQNVNNTITTFEPKSDIPYTNYWYYYSTNKLVLKTFKTNSVYSFGYQQDKLDAIYFGEYIKTYEEKEATGVYQYQEKCEGIAINTGPAVEKFECLIEEFFGKYYKFQTSDGLFTVFTFYKKSVNKKKFIDFLKTKMKLNFSFQKLDI